ncbi:ankyrin repeat domain-containing protein [Nonomuraea sp. NPDC049269]|uniref:ankyrin repeat domain-containing protein n=1 Tax=Nonomuraea sp. NPDC049269 TaxID=3364349 RepID=UPI00371D6207
MSVNERLGWSGVGWDGWTDLDLIRARLDAGADPNSGVPLHVRPLHAAAEQGSPEVITELARRVDDVDAEHEGRTALWQAVFANRPDNARALVDAGADPWRPMMGGWSPGRLSLAGLTPDLFLVPPGQAGLSTAEIEAAAESRRLIAAFGTLYVEGTGLACVAGITAAEAARRLSATPVEESEIEELGYDDDDESILTVGITDVPGGCVVSQPWGYGPEMPRVMKLLSAGTVCYGLYANPKSGNQGSIVRDGVIEGRDLHPGGGHPSSDDSANEILASFLYRYNAVAYCCAYAGLRLTNAAAVNGSPDMWVRLPDGDYWH